MHGILLARKVFTSSDKRESSVAEMRNFEGETADREC